MKIESSTVSEYLEQIPESWKPIIKHLRSQIIQHIPEGFVESIRWGMITYEVPLEISGPTYNKQPLAVVSLAAQKNYCSLYLTAVYADAEKREYLMDAFERQKLKADMGKSCIRFKKLEDIPLDEILTLIKQTSVTEFLDLVKKSQR